jgi:hypothetical protein
VRSRYHDAYDLSMTTQVPKCAARPHAGETEPLGWQDDRGIDTNHLALGSYQGTTRVPWIVGCVGLNTSIDQPPPTGPQRP